MEDVPGLLGSQRLYSGSKLGARLSQAQLTASPNGKKWVVVGAVDVAAAVIVVVSGCLWSWTFSSLETSTHPHVFFRHQEMLINFVERVSEGVWFCMVFVVLSAPNKAPNFPSM